MKKTNRGKKSSVKKSPNKRVRRVAELLADTHGIRGLKQAPVRAPSEQSDIDLFLKSLMKPSTVEIDNKVEKKVNKRTPKKKTRKMKSNKKSVQEPKRKTTPKKKTKKLSPYNMFMKEQLPKYKAENPNVEHSDAFAAVAAMWRNR
jgi:uncharacterized protein YdaU (DUF1376 family)